MLRGNLFSEMIHAMNHPFRQLHHTDIFYTKKTSFLSRCLLEHENQLLFDCLCSFKHLGEQNLKSKYSKGTLPVISIAH